MLLGCSEAIGDSQYAHLPWKVLFSAVSTSGLRYAVNEKLRSDGFPSGLKTRFACVRSRSTGRERKNSGSERRLTLIIRLLASDVGDDPRLRRGLRRTLAERLAFALRPVVVADQLLCCCEPERLLA